MSKYFIHREKSNHKIKLSETGIIIEDAWNGVLWVAFFDFVDNALSLEDLIRTALFQY